MQRVVRSMRGRISAEYRASYDILLTSGGVVTGTLRGHFHEDGAEFPKVGDYVVVTEVEPGRVVIEELEPRQNVIARIAPHDGVPQVMVANVSHVFIVMGLDADFSIPRLERYVALALQSGAEPVVVLNKADLAPDLAAQVATVEKSAPGIAVYAVTATTGEGVAALVQYTTEGHTLVLLGSSGAGKSTLTNALLGSVVQPTNSLRERDGRGRHTTTTRQLFVLPEGGHLIDTPGMRELALVDDEAGAADAFADIEALTLSCRFSNCDHEKSAGCAVQAALADGSLDAARFARYQRLKSGEERVRRVRY